MRRFHRIFAIAQAQNMLVQEAYRNNNGNVEWLINVIRNLQDWEVREFESLVHRLAAQVFSGEDKMQWKLEKSGNYYVKSYFKHLTRRDNVLSPDFTMRQIWKRKVPPRVTFFAWEACGECILTIDKLKSRGLFVPNWCYMYVKNEESCNHVLLWCSGAFGIWSLIYSLIGISWMMPVSIREELWAWECVHLNSRLIKLIPLTIFWVLWKERNFRTFKSKKRYMYRLRERWMHYFGWYFVRTW